MDVKLERRYPLGVDAQRAWALLSDVPAVAACVPGAQIIEQTAPDAYKGSVKVKVGPALALFNGQIDVLAIDPAQRRLVLRGKGADKGGSSASMELDAVIEADGEADSALRGQAQIVVSGKFAQFGARMMSQVSDMLLEQFAEHFRAAAQAMPETGAADPPAGPAASAATAGSAGGAAPQVRASPVPRQSARPPAGEINGLAILWRLLRNWLAGLFGRRGDS